MKPYLLFPIFFRPIGIVLALIGLVFGYIYLFQDKVLIFADHGSGNFTDELGTTCEVLGLIFIGFSRLKNEDERTSGIRLNALYWAVVSDLIFRFANFGLLSLGNWLKIGFIHRIAVFDDLEIFFPLVIFIARFYFLLYSAREGRKESSLFLLPYKPYLLIVKSICILFFILIWAIIQFSAIDDLIKKDLPTELFILFPICLLIWIWSKEKNETTDIEKVRLKAMHIAVYINYFLFLIATWVIYGFAYLQVLIAGLLSIPIIYLAVFYLLLPVPKIDQIETETMTL
ncbi:hypothetical protein [uncultured Mucilaginibacter sp.]|uniref:hypothetical protein n=1 Tax=uncultured Mucilaginibacter sp. TaxID=797541 RepID=UPI0025FC02A6|nr:hypothetical protein [uncultured Mucilaginibacter sp.]